MLVAGLARARLLTLLAAVGSGGLLGGLDGLNPLYAIAAVAAVGGAILIYLSPVTLVLGVLATEPWSDALHYPTYTFTIPKIVGLLAVGSFLLAAATGRVSFRFSRELGWAGAFLVVIFLSLMLSPDPSAGTAKTIQYALYVAFLALFIQLIRDRAGVERCLAVYAISSIFAAGDGVLRFLQHSVHLASGPIADPNDFAQMMAGAVPMAVFFAINGRRRLLWGLGALVLAASLAASFSRGAIVGLGVVLVWAIVTRRISLPGVLSTGLVAAVVLIVGFVFLGPLIQERLVQKSVIADTNVSSREAFWSAAERMAIDHPLLGVGPARFGAESQQYVLNDPIVLVDPVVHDSYLEILAEDGVFALLLYFGFLIAVWQSLRSVRRTSIARGDVRSRRLADALMASLLWTLAAEVFVSRQLSIPVWLIAALSAVLLAEQRGGRPVEAPALAGRGRGGSLGQLQPVG